MSDSRAKGLHYTVKDRRSGYACLICGLAGDIRMIRSEECLPGKVNPEKMDMSPTTKEIQKQTQIEYDEKVALEMARELEQLQAQAMELEQMRILQDLEMEEAQLEGLLQQQRALKLQKAAASAGLLPAVAAPEKPLENTEVAAPEKSEVATPAPEVALKVAAPERTEVAAPGRTEVAVAAPGRTEVAVAAPETTEVAAPTRSEVAAPSTEVAAPTSSEVAAPSTEVAAPTSSEVAAPSTEVAAPKRAEVASIEVATPEAKAKLPVSRAAVSTCAALGNHDCMG